LACFGLSVEIAEEGIASLLWRRFMEGFFVGSGCNRAYVDGKKFAIVIVIVIVGLLWGLNMHLST
jgi:hypothetical protein